MSAPSKPTVRFLCLLLTLTALPFSGCRFGSADDGTSAPLRVTRKTVEMPAVVDREAFERRILGMPGYHYVVWGEDRAASAALFRSQASDVAVLEALERLGLKPGNSLGMDTWDDRENPESSAPDRVLRGPLVEVLVRLRERGPLLKPGDILIDPEGRGFEMRFGGHRENIPRWRSGCVVCLYSCPGSKIGNARYTVRDWTRNPQRFRVRPGVLPEDGSRVTIVLRVKPPEL
jgi:hypothetical protein